MSFIRQLALPVLAFTLALSFCGVQVSSQVPARPFFSAVTTYPRAPQLTGFVKFHEAFSVLWGSNHQRLSRDQSGIEIWLDQSSGSGFKSLQSYTYGQFSASIKLQAGYTAGVDTSFYLSNNEVHPEAHDEIDIEFLGTIPGEPYTLQTNIYVKSPAIGSGVTVTGREEKIHLWFDPTKAFHHYGIIWSSTKIVFTVDNVEIRTYPRTDDNTFPTRPMWVYGSIWDASSWATDNGKYKVDYRYAPFVGQYLDFKISAAN